MAVTRVAPRTIFLGGGQGPGGEGAGVRVNDYVAGAVLTPGMLIETYDDSGVTKWRPHSSATNMRSTAICLERLMLGEGVDDTIPIDDLVEAMYLYPGVTFYGLLPSGADISNEEALQSNGDGYMKQATASTAAANVAWFKSKEEKGAVIVPTRVIVEVI